MAQRAKKAKTTESDPIAIDARSDELVLRYVGPATVHGVPRRDLHGGDLNRIAYVRAHAAVDWSAPDAARPRTIATPGTLRSLTEELIATGAYEANVPRGKTTDEPADPADTDEPAAPAEG